MSFQCAWTGQGAQLRPSLRLPYRPSPSGPTRTFVCHSKLMRVENAYNRHRAKWIAERTWHESQEIQSLPDGDLILSLNVADTAEVKGWILGFGQDAEVLEPASLREEIRTEAEALLRRLEVSDALKEISAEQLTLPVVGTD